MIIAVIGLAGSGKSEVAKVLADERGFDRLKFADPLKNMVRALLSTIGYEKFDIERFIEGDMKEELVPEIGRTSRFLQIDLGARWGRGVWPDFWARLLESRIKDAEPGTNFVIDDLRFPNEEALVRRLGGVIIRVDRPGAKPAAFRWGALGDMLYRIGILAGVHPSERVDRLTADIVIQNTGTVESLRRNARYQIRALLNRKFLAHAMG